MSIGMYRPICKAFLLPFPVLLALVLMPILSPLTSKKLQHCYSVCDPSLNVSIGLIIANVHLLVQSLFSKPAQISLLTFLKENTISLLNDTHIRSQKDVATSWDRRELIPVATTPGT
jgi:hypothetical protein